MAIKTITISASIPNGESTPIVSTFTVEVDENSAKDITLEYLPASEGGPLMRPKTPPR